MSVILLVVSVNIIYACNACHSQRKAEMSVVLLVVSVNLNWNNIVTQKVPLIEDIIKHFIAKLYTESTNYRTDFMVIFILKIE